MAQCRQCGRKKLLSNFARRLDIPEMRSMVSHWPWHRVRVCPECLEDFDRRFAERVQFLAPQILRESADVAEQVCLMCGTQDEKLAYTRTGRWIDPSGEPVSGKFSVCQKCRGRIIHGGVISSAEIQASPQFEKLLKAVPQLQPSTIRDIDGWDTEGGALPEGAAEVLRDLSLEAAINIAETWWAVAPRSIADAPGTTARAAMLGSGGPGGSGGRSGGGSIPTHLVLAWQTFDTNESIEMSLWVYHLPESYLIVRFDPRPA